jgi:putative membrane protein
MGWHGGMSGWGVALMTLSTALFWVLLAAGIVAVVRYTGRGGQDSTPRPTPRDVLDDRFARGEIEDDEYRRRLHVLGH